MPHTAPTARAGHHAAKPTGFALQAPAVRLVSSEIGLAGDDERQLVAMTWGYDPSSLFRINQNIKSAA